MKKYILKVWTAIDPVYFHMTRLNYICPNHLGNKNMLRIRLISYKGAEILLSDGTKIHKNDTLIKIHFHNIRLIKEMNNIQNEINKTRYIINMVKKSLPELALYIEKHEKKDKIQGIMGITSLYKVGHRLGFETFQIPSPCYRLIKRLSSSPITVLAGQKLFVNPLKRQAPQYLFMSKEHLMNKYGN